MRDPCPRSVLFVGELNPYRDPNGRFALFPMPARSSGDRLCSLILQMEPEEYLRRFARVNLCFETWSEPKARKRAVELIDAWARDVPFVLLGRKVASAFAGVNDPFTWSRGPGGGRVYVTLPHPSGLNRSWSEPGAFERAREVLRAAGVL